MIEIVTANQEFHPPQIRELLWEYLQWANARIIEEYDVSFEIGELLAAEMQDLEKYMPPKGRLLLGYAGGHPAGMACLKAAVMPGAGEIKRMYVRAGEREQGLGRALLDRLIAEAGQIGYERLRLDSARFMQAAHRLYRSAGFYEIEPFEGTEVPPDYQQNWIFMELNLRG